MTNIPQDDPRLTACALGEMDVEQRRAFEAEISKNAILNGEYEDLCETAALLEEELGRGAPLALAASRHAAIERALASSESVERGSAPEEDASGRHSEAFRRSLRHGTRRNLGAATAVLAAVALVMLFVGGGVDVPTTPQEALTETTLGEPAALPSGQAVQPAQQGEGIRRADTPSTRPRGPAVSSHTRGSKRRTVRAKQSPRPLDRAAPGDRSRDFMGFGLGGGTRRQESRKGKNKPRAWRAEPKAKATPKARPRPEPNPFVSERSNTERYSNVPENPFVPVASDPRSTFSIDVDTAAYSLVRRHIDSGSLPPHGAVRIEELINYFDYAYAPPTGEVPFSVHSEVSSAPWAPKHQLVRIGLKGKPAPASTRADANLVFLVDVSGSMSRPEKLPLLKQGLAMLARQLDAGDRLAIVVYAGSSGLVLPSTPGDRQQDILDALERLQAGGSTNGGEGIQLAYRTARANFVRGGINRVILATDGDFNVGITSESELVRLIEDEAKSGVYLSVLGFGSGNYNDSGLEKLADHGNGNYAYIDRVAEARKVLVEQAQGTLITIAEDVKIQLEMNPDKVAAFRLIGYENRVLAHRDFEDDEKDAGEIGAGHTVTALYEIVPKGVPVPGRGAGSSLRYQKPGAATEKANSNELLTVKLRYKLPGEGKSREIEQQVEDEKRAFASSSRDHRFAGAVASFGMVLRGSRHQGTSSLAQVKLMARGSAGQDSLRQEFIELVDKASRVQGR